MVRVQYESVTKKYGDEIGAEDIEFTIEDGEFAVLLGPSGCGKTTTLRCLAGLIEPTSGRILADGEDITHVHPKNRDIAMVFQNLALYPHMNVRKNMGYPLKVTGMDKDQRDERVEEVAEMLSIPELLDRDVDQVSGGQRQRVAIGRALVRRPGVFLMDEPLASLDAKLKVEMRNRVKLLQRELGITTLYVTHDQEEAMTLGDKLIVMNNGRIQQIGGPDEIFHEPANRFVAGFIGSPSMNFVTVEWTGDGNSIQAVDFPDEFNIELGEELASNLSSVNTFELGIRPQYFTVHTEPTENAIEVLVQVTEPTGDDQLITTYLGDSSNLDDPEREITVKAPTGIDVNRDDTLWLTLQEDKVHGFDMDGQRITNEKRSIQTM